MVSELQPHFQSRLETPFRQEPDRLAQLAVITAFIAGGVFMSPTFAFGAKAGLYNLPKAFAYAIGLSLFIPEKKVSASALPYSQLLKEDPFYATIYGPIREELIYRLVLQEGLTKLAEISIPLLGICAQAQKVGLIAASLIFGSAHADNNHEGAYVQAVLATLSAYTLFGPIYMQYGLLASAAAHIVNNSVIVSMDLLSR